MAFRSDTTKAKEGGQLKPEGFYEVIIDSVRRKVTPNGARSVGFTYVIRNDVNQQYKNGLIFHDVWAKREPNPDDEMAEGYNYAQLMAIAENAGLPKSAEYDTFDAFLDALVGRAIRVELYHDDYNDKYYEKIRKHLKTAFPAVKHIPKEKTAPAQSGCSAAKNTTYAGSSVSSYSDDHEVQNDDDYPF